MLLIEDMLLIKYLIAAFVAFIVFLLFSLIRMCVAVSIYFFSFESDGYLFLPFLI